METPTAPAGAGRYFWHRRAVLAGAPLALFAGLVLRGADGAAAAALFAAGLLALVLASLWIRPSTALARALREHWLSAAAAMTFVLWALATAITVPAGFGGAALEAVWHPIWTELESSKRAISMAPYRVLEGVAAFLGPCAAFALGALELKTREARLWSGRILVGLTIAFAALALLVHVTTAASGGWRLSVFFFSPNVAATAFGVLAALCAGQLTRAARHAARRRGSARLPRAVRGLNAFAAAPGAAAAFVLATTCIVLTGSRAGAPAAAVGLLVFAALLGIGRTRRPSGGGAARWGLAIVAAGAVLALGFGGHAVLQRAGTAEADFASRAVLWSTHWQAFQDRPLMGHGLNSFREINTHVMRADTWAALHVAGAAHNIYIQALEETGLIGAALWLLMLAMPVWRATRIAVSGGPGADGAAAALGALSACLAHGIADFGLQTPAIAALVAYVLALYSTAPEADGPEKRDQRNNSAPV